MPDSVAGYPLLSIAGMHHNAEFTFIVIFFQPQTSYYLFIIHEYHIWSLVETYINFVLT